MWGIILALSVALAAAGNRHLQYDLEFDTSKIFSYDYEGLVMSGLPEEGLAKSGLKLNCRVLISGAAPRLYYLKIRNLNLEEYIGIWPTDKFTSSHKLTSLLEKQLAKPIKFEFSRGQVGDLHIAHGLSQTAVNILRGILNILQLTLKKTQNTYALQENGIGGICHTSYFIQESQKTNQLLVTKSVDLNDCEYRERMVTGNAYFHTCASCKQRNKNSRATATYNYKVKATDKGGRLQEAEVREVHQFTPFNEIDGTVVVEARQRLVLAAVQEQIHSTPENNDYIAKESLRYHFERKLNPTPIQLLSISNTENQVSELLHHLVERNIGPLSLEAPEKFMQLVHHLRITSFEDIEGIWKQVSGKLHYRRWFLDAIPAIANPLSLRFLKMKIKELTEFEAAQAVPLTLHLIKADLEAIQEAKSLLEAIDRTQGGVLLRKVTYLAFGSLVNKFCNRLKFCPEESLEPLIKLLTEASDLMHNEDIILALKALGNSGQLATLKYILKFLPRFSSMASNLPLPIKFAAIMALQNLGIQNPEKVINICMHIYMDVHQHPVLRMMAAEIIFDSKPPSAVVMTIAKSLMKEPDMQVGSFVYSLMKRLSKSITTDLHEVAAVCNMAIRNLKSKFEATRNMFHTGFHFDTFTDSLMSGVASTFNILHNTVDALPLAVLSRLKTHFMGVFTDLFEIGYHADGLQELFINRHLFSTQDGLQNTKKMMDMMKKLHAWKPASSNEPFTSVYLKMFGQEIFYHELNKLSLENIFNHLPNGEFARLHTVVNALQKGVDIHWSKPLLSSENCLIVPTCVGLPLETSLYYSSVTRLQLQAQSHITPKPKEDVNILQLVESNINLKSKLSLSMAKDIIFMMGVNTNLIQSGMELRTHINVVLPANIEAMANVAQKHFKMDYIPDNQDNEILSIRSKAFAVIRNVEDSAAAKMTPVVAAGIEPNVLKQTFNPGDLSAGDTLRTEGKFSAKLLSKGGTFWSKQSPRQPKPSDFFTCFRLSHFGFQICLEKKCVTAAFLRNCPLYHIIGDHSLKLTFKPVHTVASVKKIQIEFQAGPQAATKMVRSVNVQRTDGEVGEMENPIHHIALSKLKNILHSINVTVTEGEQKNYTITVSNESSSNSVNTSESSSATSTDERTSQQLQQQSQKKNQKRANKKKHHTKYHYGGQWESEEGKKYHRRQHETKEINRHKGHYKKKEMEIHCKCWQEKRKGDHKDQHEKWEHDNQHKSGYETEEQYNHHEGRHEINEHDNHHKGLHGTEEQDKNHQDQHEKRERDRHHKNNCKINEHDHHPGGHHERREQDKHHKGQRKTEDEDHNKGQHERREQDKHYKCQRKIEDEDHDKGQHKRREQGKHYKGQRKTEDEDHNKCQHERREQDKHHKDQRKTEEEDHEKGQHERREQDKHHKDQWKTEEEDHETGQHERREQDKQHKGQRKTEDEDHDKDQHERREQDKHHKDQRKTEDEDHEKGQHERREEDKQHKGQRKTEDEDHDKGQHERREQDKQHKGERKTEDEDHEKGQHERREQDKQHKGQRKTEDEDHDKDQHEIREQDKHHKDQRKTEDEDHEKGQHERREEDKQHKGQRKTEDEDHDKGQHERREQDKQHKGERKTEDEDHEKGQHERREQDKQHKGQRKTEDEDHDKDQHEIREQDKHHKDQRKKEDEDHEKGQHERREEDKQHKGQRKTEDEDHDKGQHERREQDKQHKGQRKTEFEDHDKDQHERREQDKHHKDQRKTEEEDHDKGQHERREQHKGQRKTEDEDHDKDQHERREQDKHHKGQRKTEDEDHEKGQHEIREQDKYHKGQRETEDEDHHKGQHERTEQDKYHKGQRESEEDEDDHKGQHKRREQDNPHKGQHTFEEQDHQKHQHEKGVQDNRHKGQYEAGGEDHHHKEQHKNEKQNHHTIRHESKEVKRHCTCWRKSKHDHQKSEHESNSQHSQEENSGMKSDEKKRCKFQSSESSEGSKNSNRKGHGNYRGSSSNESSSLSQRNHENNFGKGHRRQWQNSSESSSLSHRKHERNVTRGHRRHSSKIGRVEFVKRNLTHFQNSSISKESQYDTYSRQSSNYMKLFGPQIHTAKFKSTSTLNKRRRDSSSSSSSSGLDLIPYKQNLLGRIPKFVLLVKTIMSDAHHVGYQTTAYVDPVNSRTHVVTVALSQKSSWKSCFDTSISGFHKAYATVRWGENCQDYRIAAEVSKGQLAGSPAVQLSWKWTRLPTWFKSATRSVMEFVPGIAYTLGFSETHNTNPSHQLTVRVAATSTDTFYTILKTPELTFYKHAISVPLDISLGAPWLRKLHLIELTNLPDVSLMARSAHEAECTVNTENIITFDKMNLGCSLSPENCYTVIAQDCTNQLRFLIAMRKLGQGFSTFEMNVKLGYSDIKIFSDASERFRIVLNGMWLLLQNDTYINEKDCIRIHRNSTTVTVKAPKNGVEQVSFNGQSAKIQISPLMHGKTCGLCGNADQHHQNDFQKPNHERARSCNGLVHSWTVPENSCKANCALGRQYIMLENQLIDERQSTCYSVEPVLMCVKGCQPARTVPVTVAFHCLPKDSAIGLVDWQANPRVSSDDIIKDVEAHTSCVCTDECAQI